MLLSNSIASIDNHVVDHESSTGHLHSSTIVREGNDLAPVTVSTTPRKLG